VLVGTLGRTVDDDPDLDAGDFGTWLTGVQAALDGGPPTDVPCGSCTACCTSSQFVHVGPDETDTLAHIPPELLFPAPGLPRGHVLLGYDEHGRCPMLGDSGCSIYEHRPRTCRTYDCRVFPAAGVAPDADKPLVVRRAGQWRFTHAAEDRARHDAVRSAAAFLRTHRLGPSNPTQLAVLAVEVHELFLDGADDGEERLAKVQAEVERRRARAGA
jgi:Fe-S-cluster containining protein